MRFFLPCFYLFFLLVGALPLQAQLSDGSIAPDFTITDIEGNSYSLYEKLDAGKIVIIDVFATWCGPCWNYKQENTLEEIWQKYGPQGTDEVFIFNIESDPETTLEDLNGTGSYTFGDYTINISYPIFNSSVINAPYEIINYPTVYWICPNKRTTEIGQVSLQQVSELLDNSCSLPEGENNGELLFFESDLDPFCQEAYYTTSFKFQNGGTNDIENASFDLLINDEVLHENLVWEGMLQPFQTTKINLPSIYLSNDQDQNIKVTIKEINNQTDGFLLNNTLKGNKPSPKSKSEKVLLEIQTDAFGYELYWELRDDNGIAIASGGNDLVSPNGSKPASVLLDNPNGYYESDTLYTHELSLPDIGCYEFYIIDDYQDGICCKYGEGFYRLTDDLDNIILSGGERFSVIHQDFERLSSLVATQKPPTSFRLNVFPNPASDLLYFEIQHAQNNKGHFSIYNNLGQIIKPVTAFQSSRETLSQQIDLSNIPAGIYLLRVALKEETITRKFIIE